MFNVEFYEMANRECPVEEFINGQSSCGGSFALNMVGEIKSPPTGGNFFRR